MRNKEIEGGFLYFILYTGSLAVSGVVVVVAVVHEASPCVAHCWTMLLSCCSNPWEHRVAMKWEPDDEILFFCSFASGLFKI